MIELPHALASWREELSIFPTDVALTIGPWLPRLDLAFGPLAARHNTKQGEIDGFGGLARRGPYERLLISEWLLALEIPDEFARRAAMGEHAFLEIARREPKGSQRSVVLFDAGPSQLGSPRLAHLASLIVLAKRARQSGAEFGWGIIQKPDGWCWATLNETSIIGLLEARTEREASAIDVEDWLERLDETSAADDLWIVGGPRLRELLPELPLEKVRAVERASRLEVDDILELDRRAVRLALHRGARTPASIELELPEERACVKLLRDPFEVRVAVPERAPRKIQPTANLVFSHDSRKLFLRTGGDTLLALHPSTAPRAQAGKTRLLSAYGDQIAAAGSYGRTFQVIASDSKHITVRGYSKRGVQRETYRLPELPHDFPFWHPGEKTPLQPCFFAGGPYIFIDAVGRLLAINAIDSRIEHLLSGVTAIARAGGNIVVVRNAWESEPQRGPHALSSRAIISVDATLALSELPYELDGDGDLTAFFGYGGRMGHGHVGVVAIRRWSDAWTVIDRTGVREITPAADSTVFGVMTSRANEDRPALLVIEKDGRTISFVTETMVHRLVHADERIAFAVAAPRTPLIAWLGDGGSVTVYSVEHQQVVYRVTSSGDFEITRDLEEELEP